MRELNTFEKNLIQSIYDNNMNITATAEELHKSRQTIVYHISKIKQKSGYDVSKVDELIKCMHKYKIGSMGENEPYNIILQMKQDIMKCQMQNIESKQNDVVAYLVAEGWRKL